MQISFEEEQQVFHLYNDKISYVIQVEKQRYLKHCYYGKRIKRWHSGIKDYYYDRGFCANPIAEDRTFSLDYTVEGISGVRTRGTSEVQLTN